MAAGPTASPIGRGTTRKGGTRNALPVKLRRAVGLFTPRSVDGVRLGRGCYLDGL